jgi:hypothetical protein
MFLNKKNAELSETAFLGREGAGLDTDNYLESNLVVQAIVPVLLHLSNSNSVVRAARIK